MASSDQTRSKSSLRLKKSKINLLADEWSWLKEQAEKRESYDQKPEDAYTCGDECKRRRLKVTGLGKLDFTLSLRKQGKKGGYVFSKSLVRSTGRSIDSLSNLFQIISVLPEIVQLRPYPPVGEVPIF